ncbi:MAG: hypothetical protein ACXADB_04560 [Candidatus Hermodarchaeia archaeon]|jgi:hypothetical protein
MKSNSSSPPTLPSRQDPISDIAVEWVPEESGSEIWTPEPSLEDLTDPHGRFETIPTGPPDMDEVVVTYRELPTLKYALQIALDTLCLYEGRPMYKAIKSLHNRVRAILTESQSNEKDI